MKRKSEYRLSLETLLIRLRYPSLGKRRSASPPTERRRQGGARVKRAFLDVGWTRKLLCTSLNSCPIPIVTSTPRLYLTRFAGRFGGCSGWSTLMQKLFAVLLTLISSFFHCVPSQRGPPLALLPPLTSSLRFSNHLVSRAESSLTRTSHPHDSRIACSRPWSR